MLNVVIQSKLISWVISKGDPGLKMTFFSSQSISLELSQKVPLFELIPQIKLFLN